MKVELSRLGAALESVISQRNDDFWFVHYEDDRVHMGYVLDSHEYSDEPEGFIRATWTDDGRVFYTPGVFTDELSTIVVEALVVLASENVRQLESFLGNESDARN